MAPDPQREAWTRRKMAAAKYRPNRIRLLLVAESPPEDPGRYFYFEDPKSADPMFERVAEVLFEAAPGGDKVPLLKELKRRGVFAVELKPDAPRKGEKPSTFVPPFLINLDALAPQKIVFVGSDAYDAAYRELKKAGFPVEDSRVPSATAPEAEFRREFRQALVRAGLEKMIKPLPPSKRG